MFRIRRKYLLNIVILVLTLYIIRFWFNFSPEKHVKYTPLNDFKALQNVLPGGEYRPKNTTSQEITAIIVPYRDRRRHQAIFLRHMHSFLQKQQIHYMVFFVELAESTIFNRGLLANVGFTLSRNVRNFTCFVYHDVDLLPTNEKLRYICDGRVQHFSVNNSKFDFALPYDSYLGGVVAFPGDLFEKINGFSNAYFGWGGEDDDLAKRLEDSNIHYQRPSKNIGSYYALNHAIDTGNEMVVGRYLLLQVCYTLWDKDGLNSLRFKELQRESRDLYTWFHVGVNEEEVLANTPQNLCSSIVQTVIYIMFMIIGFAVMALCARIKWSTRKSFLPAFVNVGRKADIRRDTE